MSDENRFVLILREPADRAELTGRRYSAKRFFDRGSDLWECMLRPDFEVQYKDILIGIKTEEISSINSEAIQFSVIKDSGESMPVKTLRWINAWETLPYNESTFLYIHEKEFHRSILMRMVILCLEVILEKKENKQIKEIIECMKDPDLSKLTDVLSESSAIGFGHIRSQLNEYFVRENDIRLIDIIEASAIYAGVSKGYVSASIKEQIPMEDLFLAYKSI